MTEPTNPKKSPKAAAAEKLNDAFIKGGWLLLKAYEAGDFPGDAKMERLVTQYRARMRKKKDRHRPTDHARQGYRWLQFFVNVEHEWSPARRHDYLPTLTNGGYNRGPDAFSRYTLALKMLADFIEAAAQGHSTVAKQPDALGRIAEELRELSKGLKKTLADLIEANAEAGAQTEPDKEGWSIPMKTKVLDLNAPTESEADEELPAAGTVTPVPTHHGTLFSFDRHPELSQVEWQYELFGHYSTLLLHIEAWGKPEYKAEDLGAAEVENFKAILSEGPSGMFNYVESLKSAILDAGLADRMKDEWLSILPFSGFDIAKGLPVDRTAIIGRIVDGMHPLWLKLGAEARVARKLREKATTAEQGGGTANSTPADRHAS
jgi:hypothetical protein